LKKSHDAQAYYFTRFNLFCDNSKCIIGTALFASQKTRQSFAQIFNQCLLQDPGHSEGKTVTGVKSYKRKLFLM
jgi:hypothetical protein